MKIAVYGIARDEQKNVAGFCKSAEDADIIVVGVDPGDTTEAILREHGVMAVTVAMERFRFDRYRNIVLDRIPADIDICVSLDLDERLQPGWRKKLEEKWKPGVTRYHYWLQNGSVRFMYDRIHARFGYKWMHANHECVYAIDPHSEVIAQCDLVVEHHKDVTKDRSKNLKLLQLAVAEEPDGSRMLWYLGREYLMLEDYESTIKTFKDYFESNCYWAPERAWAAIFTSRAYEQIGNAVESQVWLHAAIRFCPDLRDPYFELARHYERERHWRDVIAEIDNLLKIHGDKHNFFEKSFTDFSQVFRLKAKAHKWLGDTKGAEDALRKAERAE